MAAAGTNYTVLLRSDGSAVSCGDNQYEQGTIPALAARRGLFRLAIPSFSLFLLPAWLGTRGNSAFFNDNVHGAVRKVVWGGWVGGGLITFMAREGRLCCGRNNVEGAVRKVGWVGGVGA